jgi:hypothetical protein
MFQILPVVSKHALSLGCAGICSTAYLQETHLRISIDHVSSFHASIKLYTKFRRKGAHWRECAAEK